MDGGLESVVSLSLGERFAVERDRRRVGLPGRRPGCARTVARSTARRRRGAGPLEQSGRPVGVPGAVVHVGGDEQAPPGVVWTARQA